MSFAEPAMNSAMVKNQILKYQDLCTPNSFKDIRIIKLKFSSCALIKLSYLKFGDGDGPNLCRVKKVDVSSTFIELTNAHINCQSAIDLKLVPVVNYLFAGFYILGIKDFKDFLDKYNKPPSLLMLVT